MKNGKKEVTHASIKNKSILYQNKEPSSFVPAMKTLLIAMGCIASHLYLSGYVSSSMLFRPEFIAATPWYQHEDPDSIFV